MLEPSQYPPHHHDFTFAKESYPSSSLSQQSLVRSQTNELLSSMQQHSSISSTSSSSSASSFFDDGATLGDALLPSDFVHQTDEGLSEFGFPGALGDPFMDTSGIIHSMPNSSPINVNLDLNSSSSSSSSSFFHNNNLNHANNSNMNSMPKPTLPALPTLYNLPNTQHQQQLFQQQQNHHPLLTQQLSHPPPLLSSLSHTSTLNEANAHLNTAMTPSTLAGQKSQQQDERSRKRTRLDDMLDAAVTNTTYSQFGTVLPVQSQPIPTSTNTSFFNSSHPSHFPSPASSSSTRSIPSSSPSSSTAPFTPLPFSATSGVAHMAISPVVSTSSPSSSSSPTIATVGGRRAGRGRPPKNSKPVDSDDDDDGLNGADRETSKKVKHQMTDRVRRAKIKEGMESLRDLVLDPAINAAANANSKTVDQATIVVKSVELVRDLKDEVAQLRAKLRQLELKEYEEKEMMRSQSIFLNTINTPLPPSPLKGGDSPYVLQVNRAMQQAYQSSPLSGFMASLNAAGVSMWRVNLKGKITEVNLVFEMISGFSNDQLAGHTPCEPPLNGTLSIMPASFLRLFASVEIINDKITPPDQTQPQTIPSSSSSSSQITSSPSSTTHPSSPASDTTDEEPVQQLQQVGGSTAAASTAARLTQHQLSMSDDDVNSHLSPAFQASVAASTFSTAQAPLFSVSLSQLPAIPDNELTSFFPRYLGPPNPQMLSQPTPPASSSSSSSTAVPQHCGALGMGGECKKYGSNMPDVSQPQPHGCYLVNHLASLPANHCLKLLSRHMTAYGDILESVTTLCLVRDGKGQAEYMLSLTTPDSRRLLRRQQPTN